MDRDPSRAEYNRIIRKACEDEGRPPPKFLRQFWTFNENNPHVFEAYLRQAKGAERTGRSRVSAAKITEDLRDRPSVQTIDPEQGFKLPNQFKPYFARLLVLVRPSLEPLIAMRALGERRRGRTQLHVPTHALNGVAKGRRIGVLWARRGLWPEEEGEVDDD
jgi:hypothetical protein